MENQRKRARSGYPRHLTEEERQCLLKNYKYNPTTGEIFSRHKKRPIGSVNKRGYIKIGTNIGFVYAHRLAWLLYYKKEPRQVIDHINHCKTDNRICNLRDVSPWENNRNRRFHYNRQTGVVGVHVGKHCRKCFILKFHNKQLRFYTIDEAVVFRLRHGLAV